MRRTFEPSRFITYSSGLPSRFDVKQIRVPSGEKIGSQFWPATTEGRVLAFLLSVYGLAVLGYLTATFASFFIGRVFKSSSNSAMRLLSSPREKNVSFRSRARIHR